MGVRALTAHQVKALFDACDLATVQGKRDSVALALLVYAGLRGAEAVRLEWKDVERREVFSAVRTVLHVHGRGRRERQLIVNDWLGMLLEEWGRETGHSGRVLRRFWRGGHLGPGLTNGGLFDVIAEAGRAAGMEPLTPLDLRATYAWQRVRELGLEHTSLALGDANVDTTLRSLGDWAGRAEQPVTLIWAGGERRAEKREDVEQLELELERDSKAAT